MGRKRTHRAYDIIEYMGARIGGIYTCQYLSLQELTIPGSLHPYTLSIHPQIPIESISSNNKRVVTTIRPVIQEVKMV